MPQASEELRAKFPGYDAEALAVLEENYVVRRGGMIQPKIKGYQGTRREEDAIDYLFHEWDFGFEDKR